MKSIKKLTEFPNKQHSKLSEKNHDNATLPIKISEIRHESEDTLQEQQIQQDEAINQYRED